MKSGCSTAGCHGDEVSWEMQVGKQARHLLLPSGRWQDNQTPTLFILKLLYIRCALCKCHFGMMLAGVYYSMQKHL